MFGLDINYSDKKYCYAQRNLAFTGYTSSICSKCGRSIIIPNPTIKKNEFIIEGGKNYPDFLDYRGAGTYFLISKNALRLFIENRITGFDDYEEVSTRRETGVTIDDDNSVYFLLSINGTIDFDLRAMTLKKKRVCLSCNQYDWNIQRLSMLKSVFDMDTWDGNDLCRIKSFPGFIVCSDRLRSLVEEHKLTGLRFFDEYNIFKTI